MRWWGNGDVYLLGLRTDKSKLLCTMSAHKGPVWLPWIYAYFETTFFFKWSFRKITVRKKKLMFGKIIWQVPGWPKKNCFFFYYQITKKGIIDLTLQLLLFEIIDEWLWAQQYSGIHQKEERAGWEQGGLGGTRGRRGNRQ